ncbi:uncharacterized protein GGS22DRAFT_198500 [Annulohypoxylon maeteangense]|uniref:uncharacterized protein n=1 Tax=Annulohypoxylon maeteangense TaxID=1927788 RepID=UPI002008E648|nr:uncharacterized protein GGS22DRAFT_198500 [Annulohypoxylon maeteangense]KAI0879914.1 hypothetical protein GGS22DRAFT_198500 [Annulohypoxylon maeteangense]
MADSDAPKMPLAASSNMAMNMSTTSTPAPKPSDAPTNSVPSRDSQATTKEKSHSTRSVYSQHTETISSNHASKAVRGDKTHTREKAFNLQRIQLAEQLSNERKLSVDLEARIASLRDELARLTYSKDAYEAECATLHRQINETLETRAVVESQRNGDMSKRISFLESKLDEATENLEESILNCDLLQSSHAEAVKISDKRSDKIKQLEHELGISHIAVQDLNSKYGKLQELFEHDVKHKISGLEEAQELRAREFQQRLTIKELETNDLKQEINRLQTAFENAITEKNAAQLALVSETKRHELKILQEQKKLDDAVESWDEYLAESEKLRRNLEELEKSTKPFNQIIIICVDVSGSTAGVIHEIMHAYRDVLHMIKSINNGAKVAVVIHGNSIQHKPSPIQEISNATFRIVDSVSLPGRGATENYAFCLEQAYEILRTKVDSQNFIILIGDGNASCQNASALRDICEKLKSATIQAHSVIVSDGSIFPNSISSHSMRGISEAVGGEVQYKDTYLSAFEKLLLRERERHFEGL